ncbi:MAG: hypothetical protein ABWX92_01055 [Mycetocola sp.]
MAVTSLPTSAETVSEFLTAFPAPIESQGRRVRAIRRAHERAGAPLELPKGPMPSVLREGGPWAPVPRALAQVVKYHHPKGAHVAIRGRRDGWLIVLVGTLGFTRNEARSVTQADVQLFPQITIKGRAVARTEPATECPACAVTRWLRIAGDASLGFKSEVWRTISPIDVDEDEHDCEVGLDGLWRKASTLLPAVDSHGWVTAKAMSARSISAAMARRQTLGVVAEIKKRARPTGGRFADASMNELADAFSDVDERAAAVLLRLNEIVGESTDMLDHLKEISL